MSSTHFSTILTTANELRGKIQKIQDDAIVPGSPLANYVQYHVCFDVGLAHSFRHALLTLLIISRGIRRWLGRSTVLSRRLIRPFNVGSPSTPVLNVVTIAPSYAVLINNVLTKVKDRGTSVQQKRDAISGFRTVSLQSHFSHIVTHQTTKAITGKVNGLISPRESVNQFKTLFNTGRASTILTVYNAPAIVNQLDTVQSAITSVRGSYDKVRDLKWTSTNIPR